MKLGRSLYVLAGSLGCLVGPAARAVLLVPGVDTPLPGTSVVAEPQLAGVVLEDKLLKFAMTTGNGLVTGQVQSRVVRSSVDGTLDFYWRVLNDSTSLDDVAFFRFGLFNAPEYNANYRIDGLGDRAPISAFRFTGTQESFVNFNFSTTGVTGGSSGLHPGESSNFMLMDTSATQYAETALMDVASFGTSHASQVLAAFTPTPVPEPETYALMLGGLALLTLAVRRRSP